MTIRRNGGRRYKQTKKRIVSLLTLPYSLCKLIPVSQFKIKRRKEKRKGKHMADTAVGLKLIREDEYAIRVGDEISDAFGIGDPAVFECGGKTYIADVELDDDGNIVSNLGDTWVAIATDAEIEEDDGDDDGDGDGGGEEVEVEVGTDAEDEQAA